MTAREIVETALGLRATSAIWTCAAWPAWRTVRPVGPTRLPELR